MSDQEVSNVKNTQDKVSDVKNAQDKRQGVLTEKALANKIEKIQTQRKKHVTKMKSVIGSLKELMNDDENESQVKLQLNELIHLFKNAIELHESLLPLMPTDEQDKQNVWFSSITKYNQAFIEDVQIWLAGIIKRCGRPSDEASSQKAPPEGDVQSHKHKEKELHMLLYSQHDVQDDVSPLDSISNCGSRANSRVSSTSSAYRKAEAEMAALLTRQRLLKEKHSLEEQEEKLRRRKEELQLEADIAEVVAKATVLKMGSTVRTTASRKSNGMESYLKANEKALKFLYVDAETFVPQTVNTVKSVQQHLKEDESGPLAHVKQFNTHLPSQQKACLTGPPAHVRQYNTHLPLQQNAGPATNDNLASIMHTQNQLTQMLVHQQRLSSLPKREISVFDGNPLHFHAFMRSFEQVIESKTDNPDDCLHYFAQYTRGQPHELVKSCQHVNWCWLCKGKKSLV